MSELWRRVLYLFNRRRLDAELEADMEFHREMAASAGRNNFGNLLRMREQAREAWGWTWLDRLLQDLRYGARILARSPGFTAMVVLVLAIGISVNVSAFSLFDMVALNPLPVPNPESIVRLERHSPTNYTSEMAYPSFQFYREHAHTLSVGMAVLGIPPVQIDEDLQNTSASFVTPNYFTELGTLAAYGRMFQPALDSSAISPPTVILSYNLWQRRFAGDPSVVGRVIRISRKPFTVIGITPYTFASLGGQHPDLWLPIAQQPYLIDGSRILTDWTNSSVRMWGRLAPGVSANAAEQELRSLTDQIRKQHPDAVWDNEFIQSSPGGHLQVMQPQTYQVAMMVGILTLLILAVACANVGGLLLARGIKREHEIGIRIAIGANRRRIFRQLCTESIMLSFLSAAVGIALSYTILRITLSQTDSPKWLSPVPDWRVLLFSLGVMLLAALFFGLAPALQIARQRQRKTIARQILLAAQVAASCVLLIVSGLLVRATQHVLFTDPGFGYENTVSIDPQLRQHGYSDAVARSYLDQMQSRLRTLPGVRSVSLVELPPMGHAVSREDRDFNGRKFKIYPNWISPEYFETMQIPILLGRTFRPGEKNAVIVSQSFARSVWGGQNPIGQRVPGDDSKDIVIGVVGDAHINALSDDDAVEGYYAAQNGNMPNMVIMVRSAGLLSAVETAARSFSESLDPKVFPELRPLKQLYHDIALQIEQISAVVSLVGIVAVVLAGIGIVGLVAFSVSQRTKEMAIRLALGATKRKLCAALLQQFTWPILVGLSAGTVLAAFASRFLRVALFGVSNLDPFGYAAAIALLLLIIAVAALLPARRALRLDVARALHCE
jgi:predicted permease